MIRKLTQFSGECTLQRNGVDVMMKNSKARLKTFRIMTSATEEYEAHQQNTELQIMVGNTEEVLFKCLVSSMHKMHCSFIKDGRMTLEIAEDVPDRMRISSSLDISKKTYQREIKTLMILMKKIDPKILHNFAMRLQDLKKRPILKENNTQSEESKGRNGGGMDLENVNGDSSASTSKNSNNTNGNGMNFQAKLNPNVYKANRDTLNNLFNRQKSQELKRKFDSVQKSSSIEQITQSEKKVKVYTNNLFKMANESIIGHILSFLTHKEFIEAKLLSKDFYRMINNFKTFIDFSGKGDVPPSVIVKLLNSCKHIQKLSLGKSKMLNQRQFLEEIRCDFNVLKSLDCSQYTNLSDKILFKFYYNCKQMETIRVGYHSYLTDAAVDLLPNVIDTVKAFKIKNQNKNNTTRNDKIKDTCLAKFLKKYKQLEQFTIYIVGPNFLYKTFDESPLGLTTLKIDHLMLNTSADLVLIENIGKCPNLQYLKIGNIRIEKLNAVLSKSDSEPFEGMLTNLSGLKTIKFGGFTNNYILGLIAKHCQGLSRFVLGSDNVDDNGLELILSKADQLETIDISKCKTINGHCFEKLLSWNLKKVIVSFDDYRVRCMEQLFASMQIQVNIVNNSKLRFR